MTETVFTNVSIRQATKDRLKMMAHSEGRTIAGLLALLVNERYARWIASRRKGTGAAI